MPVHPVNLKPGLKIHLAEIESACSSGVPPLGQRRLFAEMACCPQRCEIAPREA
jgi:hypothetical protein